MAGTFPQLGNGARQQYPLKRSFRFGVTALEFANGTKQRWLSAPWSNQFEVALSNLTEAEMTAQRNFFDTQKGSFDHFTYVVDADVADGCYYAGDTLAVSESGSRYALTVQLEQMGGGHHDTIPSVAATFPALATGAVTQVGYSAGRTWRTAAMRSPGGYRYSRYQRSSATREWIVTADMVTPAEATAIVQLFLAMKGSYGPFSFTDTAGTVHTGVRFAEPKLELTYHSARRWGVAPMKLVKD